MTLSVLFLAGWTLPVSADHPQSVDGETVVFDHIKGNEWWVEVTVDWNGNPDRVFARDSDPGWHELDLKSWGTWGGSFHISPGDEVAFMAMKGDATVWSCWFSHPGGVERCDTRDEFEASFDTPGGNEWWVEVYVEANQPLAGVDARADGGAWQALDLRDWGAWAKSFHVPDGSIVEFRAHATTGETDMSGQYVWPSGEPAGDDGGDFTATFSTPGGNEWWVEVYVSANEPLAGVDARANSGTWQALTLRDWGAWAKSFHVPDGSIVEFRAHATTGETAMSGQYVWPSGDPVEGDPGPTTLDAAFGPKASNEWWVETVAIAETPLVSVEARADGGAWHPLELKDWMAWAGSFHVPDGSIVEFRATDEDGRVGLSQGFVWPSADPVGVDTSEWPHEGAYAHYRHSWGVAGTAHGDVDALFVHHDGSWRVLCVGTGYDGGEPYFKYDQFAPPFGPITVPRDEQVDIGHEEVVGAMDECNPTSYTLTVEDTHEHEIRRDGDPVTVDTWFGRWVPECNCDYNQADWEMWKEGLVIHFRDGMTDWAGGDLQDTNAPIGD